MAQTSNMTQEQRRFNQHVERETDLIAGSVEGTDGVSEVKAGRGVIHVHMKPGHQISEPVLLPLTEQGAWLDRVEVRDRNSTVARLYARFVVPDDRLREGFNADN